MSGPKPRVEAAHRLTLVQWDTLNAMRSGTIVTIYRRDSFEGYYSYLADKLILPNTWDALLNNGYVERIDRSKPASTAGNGYKVSVSGLAVLELQFRPNEKQASGTTSNSLPTERQMEYALRLGLSIPAGISRWELSDLISFSSSFDEPARSEDQYWAKYFDVPASKYAGRKTIYERIFDRLNLPTRERDLVMWFVFRVYRCATSNRSKWIDSPRDPSICKIADELMMDRRIFGSIKRYRYSALLSFGERVLPDGGVVIGDSKRSVAYRTTLSILQNRGFV